MTSFQCRVMETVPSGDLRESARGAPGPVLHTPQGRPYRFDPGVLCLKLLPTGGHRGYARYEVLHTPADPVRWAGQSPMVPAPELAVSAGELARAHELRSVLRRLTTAQERAEVLDGGARGGSARWTGWPPRRAEPGRGEPSPAWLIGMLPGWTSAGRFPDPPESGLRCRDGSGGGTRGLPGPSPEGCTICAVSARAVGAAAQMTAETATVAVATHMSVRECLSKCRVRVIGVREM